MNTKGKGAIITADNIADKRQIDWEQRRYEIAKDMLVAIYIDDGNEQRDVDPNNAWFEFKSPQDSVREALRYADALIEELKKNEVE